MTFADLRDARLGPLTGAAQAWADLARALASLEQRTVAELTGPLRASGWHGDAAQQAFRRMDLLDDEFEVAAMQTRTAASVLRQAADEFRALQQRLEGALEAVTSLGLPVDEAGGVHAPEMSWAERHDPDGEVLYRRRVQNAAIYSDLIVRILGEAEDADARIARALSGLQPAMPGQYEWEYNKAAKGAEAAAAALGLTASGIPKPGTDPAAVAAWWRSLSADDRHVYLTAYPQRFGALDGMPATDRNYANQLALREFVGDNVNHQRDRDNQHDRALMLQNKLESAENNAAHKQFYLLSFDPVGDGKAAVAIGNPDTAAHTAVLIPGVGTELDDIRGLISRADRIQDAAVDATEGGEDVAVVAWLGYDTPSVDEDIVTAPFGRKSVAGAEALDGFVNGLNAANDDPASHVTVIGHSYGSTVVGEAASRGDGIAAHDIVAVGSPGMRVHNVGEFNVDARHVWVGAAADDSFIARPENVTSWLRDIPIVGGWVADAVEGIHGPGPHNPQFGGNVLHIDTQGHSGYWDLDSQSLRSQGAIVAGHYDDARLDHGRAPT